MCNSHNHLKTIETDILHENDSCADANRHYFTAHNILCINMASSPGSGKTTLLEATIAKLKDSHDIAVIEGDQATDNDCRRIAATGCKCRQINTLSGCHLDATMIKNAVESMDIPDGAILFVENVGNLVCPALFDLGETVRVVVMSVTEGDDKPLKYPYMWTESQLCIINKIDLLPHLPQCDIKVIRTNCTRINPDIDIIATSATTGDGIDTWCDWIKSRRRNRNLTSHHFDRLATDWDKDNEHSSKVITPLLELLHIEPGHSVLDVGCGTGILLPYLSQLVQDDGKVTELDCSSRMIELAKLKGTPITGNVVYKNIDIETTHIKEKYDRIVLMNMFPHLHSPFETVRTLMNENLTTDGRLLIAHTMSRENINNHHRQSLADPDYMLLPEIQVLVDFFETAGLKVVHAEDTSKTYTLLLEK